MMDTIMEFVSLFSTALNFSFLGAFILRIGLGLWFLASGSALLSGRVLWSGETIAKTRRVRIVGALDGIVGVLLLAGMFTQGAALLGLLLSAGRIAGAIRRSGALFLFILLFLACLAQITFGPGPFSVDLPL